MFFLVFCVIFYFCFGVYLFGGGEYWLGFCIYVVLFFEFFDLIEAVLKGFISGLGLCVFWVLCFDSSSGCSVVLVEVFLVGSGDVFLGGFLLDMSVFMLKGSLEILMWCFFVVFLVFLGFGFGLVIIVGFFLLGENKLLFLDGEVMIFLFYVVFDVWFCW